jgi:hypothetical protein
MASTAEDLVEWYRRALKGEFFRKPETLVEFKRIQSMADSLWQVVPPDTPAYGKGGSIDWQGFHCLSLAGEITRLGEYSSATRRTPGGAARALPKGAKGLRACQGIAGKSGDWRMSCATRPHLLEG